VKAESTTYGLDVAVEVLPVLVSANVALL